MFDSGFGGLTVARAMIDLLPDEDLVYLGDTARYPYGSRSLDEVAGFAHGIAEHLVAHHDIKALVVACNTAAAAALDELAESVPVPVVGVVEPGVRALVDASVTGRVAVIGTVGTVGSGAYQSALGRVLAGRGGADGSAERPEVELEAVACPGFVEFVERGVTVGDEVTVLAERLLAPICEADIDALLLGCTHYPFLARTISDVMGPKVTLVSSADETAFDARRILAELDLLRPAGSRPGRHRFLSSGDIEWFRILGGRLLGPELDHTQPWPVHGDEPDQPEPDQQGAPT